MGAVGAVKADLRGYFGTCMVGVVECGWKMGTTCSHAKKVAGRTKERKVRESTRGVDAVVPYLVETSVARDGKRLRVPIKRRV